MPNRLDRAEIVEPSIKSGGAATLKVEWRSTAAGPLHLNYDADDFAITPPHIDLPADPSGAKSFSLTIVRTRTATTCDIHFHFFADDTADSIEVTP
jgi:hypothetical protein